MVQYSYILTQFEYRRLYLSSPNMFISCPIILPYFGKFFDFLLTFWPLSQEQKYTCTVVQHQESSSKLRLLSILSGMSFQFSSYCNTQSASTMYALERAYGGQQNENLEYDWDVGESTTYGPCLHMDTVSHRLKYSNTHIEWNSAVKFIHLL